MALTSRKIQVIFHVFGHLSVWVTSQFQNTLKNYYSFKDYITITLKGAKYYIYQNFIMVVMNKNSLDKHIHTILG